jgi:hypothetical protein
VRQSTQVKHLSLLCGLLMTVIVSSGAPVMAQRIERLATLRGSSSFPAAKGEARFRSRDTARRDLKVQVENVNLPAGSRLSVFVDGAQVGTLTLVAGGRGELQLSTENGQAVPNLSTGTHTVQVTTPAQVLVVSGQFL